MKCIKPFVSAGGAFGCGQCLPCRVKMRRIWKYRMLLECMDHRHSAFVTLTYEGDAVSLVPEHLQKWLKRIRQRFAPGKLRFYAVGEYGDNTQRPHYHAALFGYPSCGGGKLLRGECQCRSCLDVRETWGYGHVMVLPMAPVRAQYLAGYVTKKMTRTDDPRLHGRWPEFSRMSLRPGIGANAMWNVASEVMRYNTDVPAVLRYEGKLFPVGRYLRSKIRVMTGVPVKDEWSMYEASKRMQVVYALSKADKRSVRSIFEEANAPYAAKLAFRETLARRVL